MSVLAGRILAEPGRTETVPLEPGVASGCRRAILPLLWRFTMVTIQPQQRHYSPVNSKTINQVDSKGIEDITRSKAYLGTVIWPLNVDFRGCRRSHGLRSPSLVVVSGGSSSNRRIVDLIASVGRLGNVIDNGLKR